MFNYKSEKQNIKMENNIKRDKLLLSIIAIFISLYSAFSLTAFACAADSIQNSVVRLHILANSDSQRDQNVKIQVRDALLNENTRLLSEGVSRENAYAYFSQSKDRLTEIANSTLHKAGFSYNAKITLEEEFYETRQYGALTFPAGEYLSLKVVLGEGEGHNWWCVMFPPMCVPAADDVSADGKTAEEYLTQSENELINGGSKYVMKFKILELYEELRERLGL